MDERNFAYMFYGFSAAWALVAAYIISLVLRERRIRSEMESLRRMIEGAKE